ncbi:hypothetical protein HPB51_024917 [Rhipicephalus microplus]|uniref:Uncharacterized protein n=1 Tax=Rhipicephalus microplus TaxID=6941 RepID=A0A9J6DY27_RHIMP|nr:hypothetical protein HPB51_024917 [Rhipicephalus microplus]
MTPAVGAADTPPPPLQPARPRDPCSASTAGSREHRAETGSAAHATSTAVAHRLQCFAMRDMSHPATSPKLQSSICQSITDEYEKQHVGAHEEASEPPLVRQPAKTLDSAKGAVCQEKRSVAYQVERSARCSAERQACICSVMGPYLSISPDTLFEKLPAKTTKAPLDKIVEDDCVTCRNISTGNILP